MIRKDKAVFERLADRDNGNKTDHYKIGLIFEGGGMRGAFSSAVACGLQRIGLSEAFDIVYGSSAGSCAAIYFVSKDIEEGRKIYFEDLNDFKFIKPWNPKRLMDIDYLCETVFRKTKPINVDNLKNSKTLLKMFVTEAESGKSKFFTNRDNEDLINVVKASCAAPFTCKPVEISGIKYFDGNVAKKLPILEAIEDGCTDILVVTTVPEGYRESRFTPLSILRLSLFRLSKNFQNAYSQRIKKYNEALDIAFGVNRKYENINIYTICPDYYPLQTETSSEKLKKLSEHGINKIIKEIEGGVNEKVNN